MLLLSTLVAIIFLNTMYARYETVSAMHEPEEEDHPMETFEAYWLACHMHSDSFHAFSVFIIHGEDDRPLGIVCIDDFLAWSDPLRAHRTSPYDECLANLYTFINYFNIPRERFQQLIDDTGIDFMLHFNLDILYSGDWELINAYYDIANQELHDQLSQARQDAFYVEAIGELQQVINNNTNMSRYFHDILTYATFMRGKSFFHRWMWNLINAGEYERVNIVEFVNYFRIPRESFERFVREYHMNLFTHYNIDVIFSGDWDLIMSYYAAENEAAHTAIVQAAFDRYTAMHGAPDTSWMLADARALITRQDFAPALGVQTRTIRFQVGSMAHTVNGVPHANDVAPFIDTAYNRTMIPLRAVSEAMGAEVDWCPETRTAHIYTGNDVHQLTIGVPLPGDMGVPVIVQGRVLVPFRYVSEVLGATIRWDALNTAAYVYQHVTAE